MAERIGFYVIGISVSYGYILIYTSLYPNCKTAHSMIASDLRNWKGNTYYSNRSKIPFSLKVSYMQWCYNNKVQFSFEYKLWVVVNL